MTSDTKLVFCWLLIIGCWVFVVFQIIWANECGHIGGAYIIPQSGFPVCVQGVAK